MYLIKWAGQFRVFEDDAGTLSCPFEVIATKTALSNAAALAPTHSSRRQLASKICACVWQHRHGL